MLLIRLFPMQHSIYHSNVISQILLHAARFRLKHTQTLGLKIKHSARVRVPTRLPHSQRDDKLRLNRLTENLIQSITFNDTDCG